MSLLGRLLASTPSGQDRLRNFGQSLARGGRPRMAQWALEQVALYGEPDATLLFKLGQLQAREGDLEAALTSLRAGLELAPNFYLCRRLLFETCRALYWSPEGPGARSQAHALTAVHDLARPAIPPFLRREIGRLAEEDIFAPMFERLAGREGPPPAHLTSYRDGLLAAFKAADACAPSDPAAQGLRVETRDNRRFNVWGLHDADDLIGYHLEVIQGDGLRFIPLSELLSLTLGAASDFMRATLTLKGGEPEEVVLPQTYFGSGDAALEELRIGEVTILQSLFPGKRVGLGRRIFLGRSAPHEGAPRSPEGDVSVNMGELAGLYALDFPG